MQFAAALGNIIGATYEEVVEAFLGEKYQEYIMSSIDSSCIKSP